MCQLLKGQLVKSNWNLKVTKLYRGQRITRVIASCCHCTVCCCYLLLAQLATLPRATVLSSTRFRSLNMTGELGPDTACRDRQRPVWWREIHSGGDSRFWHVRTGGQQSERVHHGRSRGFDSNFGELSCWPSLFTSSGSNTADPWFTKFTCFKVTSFA